MKKTIFKSLFLFLILFTLFTIPKYTYSDTFDLSYSLTEGGTRLELDPANPYKGVKITITSDVATRYEVIQKVLMPLQNRDNPSVVIRDNFVLRGLRGTNAHGTFQIPPTDTVVRRDEILYTSDTAGTADTFTLVYGIANIETVVPGYYQGQIGFTLRPIGSTRSELTQYLYVYVSVAPEEKAGASVEITTALGAKTITLNPKKEETQTQDILVKINGKFRKMFSIVQFLPQPLESKEGNQLNYDLLNVVAKEAKKGVGIAAIPLSFNKPQTLYTSGPNGEADESFIVTYGLEDLSTQKAGRYASTIQYFLDEAGIQTKLDTLGLEVEVERIFDLVITPEDQKGTIEFRNLKAREEPKKNEVVIEIKSNIGRAYQVTQNIKSELTDKEGNTIPANRFLLKTEGPDVKGTLKFPNKEEAKKGEVTLFISDNQGSADKFKVIYELAVPPEVKAGDYSANISYSLVEI